MIQGQTQARSSRRTANCHGSETHERSKVTKRIQQGGEGRGNNRKREGGKEICTCNAEAFHKMHNSQEEADRRGGWDERSFWELTTGPESTTRRLAVTGIKNIWEGRYLVLYL